MKNLSLVSLFALVIIIGCKKRPPVNYAILTGEITNLAGGRIALVKGRSLVKYIELTEAGTFIDTLKVMPGFYTLTTSKNKISIYIDKGDNMKVDFDNNNFKNTLKVSGKGSEKIAYIKEKSEMKDRLLTQKSKMYSLEEAAYLKLIRSAKDSLITHVENTEGLPEDFIEKEKRDIHYEYLGNLDRYPDIHASYTKNKKFKTSDGFLKELDGLSYENGEDYLFSINYQTLVRKRCNKRLQEILKQGKVNLYIAYLQAIGEIKNDIIRNDLLYDAAQLNITQTKDLENYFNTYMSFATDSTHIENITKSYNKLSLVNKGKPSPKFTNYENYAGGTTSLDDFKGKYVYIDIWATWCGPCKAEIPFLKEIEKEYHDKNIEFVSISVDNKGEHEAWKKMVEEKELGGVQLFADNAFSSKFISDYMIMAIPRFILLDPEGKVVDSQAPRPSSTKLKEILTELSL